MEFTIRGYLNAHFNEDLCDLPINKVKKIQLKILDSGEIQKLKKILANYSPTLSLPIRPCSEGGILVKFQSPALISKLGEKSKSQAPSAWFNQEFIARAKIKKYTFSSGEKNISGLQFNLKNIDLTI